MKKNKELPGTAEVMTDERSVTAAESAKVFVGEVFVSVRVAITKHCRDYICILLQ